MRVTRLLRLGLVRGWVVVSSVLGFGFPSLGQIVVNGLADRDVVADRATFQVPAVPGFQYEVMLDGEAVPIGRTNEVTAVDYHELMIRRSPLTGGVAENRLVRFIVRSSERGNTEWGLPPWTPPPVVPSSPAELAAGRLRLSVPAAYPAGMDVPVVAWLDASDGHALRANADLVSTAHRPIRLRRGVGAGWITAPAGRGVWRYQAAIPGQNLERAITIEATTPWREVGGTWPDTDGFWPAASRIAVTNPLVVAAHRTLTIDAGTLVRLAPGVEIAVLGTLIVRGTAEAPVVFAPAAAAQPWGGFLVLSNGVFSAENTFFVGSGANAAWFDQHSGYDVHRREQALLLVNGGTATLTDCAAFDGAGQFGHGKNGVLTLERTLVQRFITGGEYNGGTVRIHDSALLEFPRDDGTFADGDNDGIYFTSGHHVVADSLIGWAKDDGIDAGSGGSGSVWATNVWVEGNFHEAFAWSGGGRHATNQHCVAFHCGQGIECGWSTGADSPLVFAEDCLVLENAAGLRFGDNYDWTYTGFLRVTNSLALFNHRDVFGVNWDDWSYRADQMDVRSNLLSSVDPNQPGNQLWEPARDGSRLASFSNIPAEAPPGVGFAARPGSVDLTELRRGFVVGLSRFVHHPVTVGFVVESPSQVLASGFVEFIAGQTLKHLPDDIVVPAGAPLVRVRLESPSGAVITGPEALFVVSPTADRTVLVPTGAEWRYRDTGKDPGDAWSLPGYDDSAWKIGRAEFGYGDGDEATVIDGGPSNAHYATSWFRRAFVVSDPGRYGEIEIRLRRDDGGIVHLNGREVVRSNLPDGVVTADTYTGTGTTSETEFFSYRVPSDTLLAGTNVVAVEVHQASATSSDVSFDLELVAAPALRLRWERFGPETVLFWDDALAELEESDSPTGPWRLAGDGEGNPRVIAVTGTRFYRVMRPRLP